MTPTESHVPAAAPPYGGRRHFPGLNTASALLAAVVLVAGAVLLHVFPPAESGFYPRCQFHAWTGLHCPGCGGLRAAHCLLHGRWAAAFHCNPLLLTLGPLLAAGWLWRRVRERNGGPVRLLPAWAVWCLFGVVLGFTVLRNLPAFAWMTPAGCGF